MRDLVTEGFNKGIYNIIDAENIPQQAAQDSRNWRSVEDRIEFIGGRQVLGTPSAITTGVTSAYYVNVNYKDIYSKSSFAAINQEFGFLKRIGKKLYAWSDAGGAGAGSWYALPIVGTSTTDLFMEDEEVYMHRGQAEYNSLAGRFIYVVGSKSNIYKLDPFALNNSTYAFVTRVYDSAKNFLGNFFFDKSRTILWGRELDQTGLYLSKIDPQGANYTTVTGESLTITGSKVNTRLAACVSNEKRHVLALVLTTPTGTYRDDRKGGFVNTTTGVSIPRFDNSLTAANPIGATIIYNTGQILISFNPVQTGTCTATYQWEDPTVDGVWDFTFSIPRLPGEGEIIRQDAGGDPILSVLPYRGVYYSIKNSTSYQMTIANTGDVESNTIFARNLGIESRNAVVATDTGIVYIDTSDRRFPRLKILKNLEYGGVIEPVEIAEHFRFADYNYKTSYFEIYNNNILITCKTLQAEVDGRPNDTVLFYDLRNNAVSAFSYRADVLTTGGSKLFGADPITDDIYEMFKGFTDNGQQIQNYWIGKDEYYDKQFLKKFTWLRLKGRIGLGAKIKVYINYDKSGEQWVGTVLGDGTYVDAYGEYMLGGAPIGEQLIGGDNPIISSDLGNPFFCELKIYCPKFRTRTVKFVVEGTNYASIDLMIDNKIHFYENRLPNRFRTKANVSLSGTENNPLPHYAQ